MDVKGKKRQPGIREYRFYFCLWGRCIVKQKTICEQKGIDKYFTVLQVSGAALWPHFRLFALQEITESSGTDVSLSRGGVSNGIRFFH